MLLYTLRKPSPFKKASVLFNSEQCTIFRLGSTTVFAGSLLLKKVGTGTWPASSPAQPQLLLLPHSCSASGPEGPESTFQNLPLAHPSSGQIVKQQCCEVFYASIQASLPSLGVADDLKKLGGRGAFQGRGTEVELK